ncbi:hypothetical protein DDE05_40485 [Streptomyces cavourensis]|nr:hypothetical protein DDE05_40485 [Streptomyces cavourensis]
MLTELAAASENRREATTSCIAPEIRNMMEQFEWNIFRATRDYLGMERGEIARWLRLCEPTYEAIETGQVRLCEWTAPTLEREMVRLIGIQDVRGDGRGARLVDRMSSQAYT